MTADSLGPCPRPLEFDALSLSFALGKLRFAKFNVTVYWWWQRWSRAYREDMEMLGTYIRVVSQLVEHGKEEPNLSDVLTLTHAEEFYKSRGGK